MDLLFTPENFSAKIKSYLGFVDADLKFVRLKSDVMFATNEIIDLIGETAYNEIKDSAEDSEFRFLVECAIALKAYINYAPTADLSHTNNGRLMRRDDHNVSAFQWQIDANDDSLEQKYYRHLDSLLKFMALNNKDINQKKYDHANLLVPSLDIFEGEFNVNGSYLLYLKLLPALRECENLEILPRTGTEKFEALKTTSPDPQLLALAQKICVNYALAWGAMRLNAQLFPKGILIYANSPNQGSGKNIKPSDKLQYLEAAMIFEADYRKYLVRLEERVSKLNEEPVTNPGIVEMPQLGFDRYSKFIDT